MTYSFDIVDEDSDRSVITVRITVPTGSALVMGEYRVEGRALRLFGAHIITGSGVRVSMKEMRIVAGLVMEALDYDWIIVEGAVRTSGARPGHRPRTLRFARFD